MAHAPAQSAAYAEPPVFYLKEDHHPENGTSLGFWLYLMSDCLIFATLFATYAVVGRNYAVSPSGADLFDLKLVAINTGFLLFSSITYGFAMLEMEKKKVKTTLIWLGVTGLFGLAFLAVELYEFHHLIAEGATAAFGLPVRLLRAGRYARSARYVRRHLARHADGPGRQTWPHPGEQAPPDVPVDVLALP